MLQHRETMLSAVQVQQLPQRRCPRRGTHGCCKAHSAAQPNSVFPQDSGRRQRCSPGSHSYWRSGNSQRAPLCHTTQLHVAATVARPWLPLQEKRLPKALLRVFPSRSHLWSSLQVHKLVCSHFYTNSLTPSLTIRLQPEHQRGHIL